MAQIPQTQRPPDTAAESVRDRLAAAALELFNQRGYAATSVREIVEAAGVTKPVLYYHFQSKEGIYLHLMRTGFAPFDEILEHALVRPGSAGARLNDLLLNLYDLFVAHEAEARLMFAIYYGPPQGAPAFDFDAYHDRVHAAIENLLDAGVRSGEFRDGDRQAMAFVALAPLNIAMEARLCSRPRGFGREGLLHALEIVLAGLSAGTRNARVAS